MSASERNLAVTGEAREAMRRLMPSAEGTRQDVAVMLSVAKSNLGPFLDDPQRTKDLIAVLMEVANDTGSRQRVRAAQVLLESIGRAIDQQIKVMEYKDKADRLDAGEATENIGGIKIVFEEAKPPKEDGE